jgi:4-azaleucine resistance transporter AzlC
MMGRAVKAAFPRTLPVMTGYLFLGIAFGLLLSSRGYGWGFAFVMSVFIYAGSMQFVAVGLLAAPLDVGAAVVLTFMVNARHIFYGLSMLDRFRDTGKWKPYLIFALTDETYSLLCTAPVPKDIPKGTFYGAISLLDHLYWIVGSTLGTLCGSLFSFDIQGIDFVMTALFVVIFLDQWEKSRNHTAALTGIFITAVCLFVFGSQWFLIPSMGGILLAITVLRGRLEVKYHALANA